MSTMTGNLYLGADDLGALIPTRDIVMRGMDGAVLDAAERLFIGFDARSVEVQIAHGSTLSTLGYATRSDESGEWTLSMLAVTDYRTHADPDDTYSGGTVSVDVDDRECECGGEHEHADTGRDEYDANDDYVDSYDDYYEQDTYAGDRWGAWMDDIRLPFEPPHTVHATASDFLPTQWREEVAKGDEWRSYDEWAEAQAAYACEDCNAYAADYSERMAERRAGC